MDIPRKDGLILIFLTAPDDGWSEDSGITLVNDYLPQVNEALLERKYSAEDE